MYEVCRHIKTNGIPCESPALKGGHFCYYHSKTHTIGAEPNLKYGPLQLPIPEDPAAIQLSVARISDAIINNRIDLKKANSLFYGLQIAAQFIDRRAHFEAKDTVPEAEQSPQGDDLASREFECDDDDDCNDCPYANDCERCAHADDDEDDECEEDEEVEDEGEDEDVEDEAREDDQEEESEDEEDGETGEQSHGRLQKKQVAPVPNGLDALRRSLAKVIDQERGGSG